MDHRPSLPAGSSGETGETAEERAAEARPFGLDLESPLFVGGAIVISLLLAAAVLRSTATSVSAAVAAFAGLFAAFDALELRSQLAASRTSLALIAALLLVLHVVAGLIALWPDRSRK